MSRSVQSSADCVDSAGLRLRETKKESGAASSVCHSVGWLERRMFGPEKSSFAHGGRGAGGISSVEVNTKTNTTKY